MTAEEWRGIHGPFPAANSALTIPEELGMLGTLTYPAITPMLAAGCLRQKNKEA